MKAVKNLKTNPDKSAFKCRLIGNFIICRFFSHPLIYTIKIIELL